MKILGISSQFHDAAVTVTDGPDIVFAAHAERYSREKNDPYINRDLIDAALRYGEPDVIALHEKTWVKKLRQINNFHFSSAKETGIEEWIDKFYPRIKDIPRVSYWHHQTHAAAGVMTSPYDECAVMVIDAIGEFDTASIWHWKDNKLTKKHSVKYPNSLGLFYSAVTDYVGLKPMEDEYILMGMAAYGSHPFKTEVAHHMFDSYISNKGKSFKSRKNLHKGIGTDRVLSYYDEADVAAGAQHVAETIIMNYARTAKNLTGSSNLVFMGGVALNCVANSRLYRLFDNIHIMPNPGDAGSSLGAAAMHYHTTTGSKLNWVSPYLGTDIPGLYPVNKALDSLRAGEIFGIANGKAEFGPRALGNRSLMADPRGDDIQDKVNEIKRRQEFRPFAPVIMEEKANEYFEMPGNKPSPYMQVVARCKYPREFPAITHHDGTSRVQTVNKDQHRELYELLSKFYDETGCPMLLNTSLNVKGQPLVNTISDAREFEKTYNVKVHIRDNV